MCGPRLDRRVRYVDVNARDGGAFHAYAFGKHRADADAKSWIANLARHQIGWVALARPWHTKAFPAEADFAAAHPTRFREVYRSAATRIYALTPP